MSKCSLLMNSQENTRLLTKIATLYYKSQLSQQDIARRLGLSRQTVGRMLHKALDLGIVHIEIQPHVNYVTDVEIQLEEIFDLKEAVVVSVPTDVSDDIRAAIGRAAAGLVEHWVKDGDILGIASGSTTLYEFAQYLKPVRLPNLTVVSLTGSAPRSPSPTNFESTAQIIGHKFGGKTVLLPAPAFVGRPEIKESLLSDPNIEEIIALGHRSNITVVGIGPISEESSPYRQGFIEGPLLKDLQQKGCVGEICGQTFDARGEVCPTGLSARAIAIELSSLRDKEISAALAGGPNKLEAIWGALQGRFLNVLVTDEATARALLVRAKGGDASDDK